MALSRSELGTASRRAWLPSVSQEKRAGGSPSSMVRSSARRVSASPTMPTTRPVGETTGKCRMPRSIMSTRTSLPERSLDTVNAGAVITAETGESIGSPPPTSLERRSLSVTMPTVCPRSTTRAVAPASVSCRAASRTGVPGAQITGAKRMEALTGSRSLSRAISEPGSDRPRWCRSSSISRVTYRRPWGWASTSDATSPGIR